MASVVVAGMTLVAALLAWGGLAWVILTVPPSRPFAINAGYVFAFVAITATAALCMWVARRPRTEDGQLKSPAGYLMHAMLLAIIVLFGMWLQALRTLTPLVGLLLAGLYAVLELAVLFGTRGSVELPMRRS
jgi:FtsH-binding integral membrane protein